MKKISATLLIGLGVLALLFFLVGRVSATQDNPAPAKYFVCKYVGTPGEDERLQTGQNPISVSENAIKDFQGVGSYFNDKHGRSFVLVEDTGQEEPDVSECPAPEVPEEPEEPETPNGRGSGPDEPQVEAVPQGGVSTGLGGAAR